MISQLYKLLPIKNSPILCTVQNDWFSNKTLQQYYSKTEVMLSGMFIHFQMT